MVGHTPSIADGKTLIYELNMLSMLLILLYLKFNYTLTTIKCYLIIIDVQISPKPRRLANQPHNEILGIQVQYKHILHIYTLYLTHTQTMSQRIPWT